MMKSLCVLAALMVLAPPGSPEGGTNGTPAITWWTVDGGGGTASAGAFELRGTIGQPDAGVASGGGFTLAGGFWTGGDTTPPCPEDIDGDGVIAVGDLLAVLADWGGSGAADVTGDGTVDVADLLAVLAAWGGCPT